VEAVVYPSVVYNAVGTAEEVSELEMKQEGVNEMGGRSWLCKRMKRGDRAIFPVTLPTRNLDK
jgi:hypothetical protein